MALPTPALSFFQRFLCSTRNIRSQVFCAHIRHLSFLLYDNSAETFFFLEGNSGCWVFYSLLDYDGTIHFLIWLSHCYSNFHKMYILTDWRRYAVYWEISSKMVSLYAIRRKRMWKVCVAEECFFLWMVTRAVPIQTSNELDLTLLRRNLLHDRWCFAPKACCLLGFLCFFDDPSYGDNNSFQDVDDFRWTGISAPIRTKFYHSLH